MNSYKHIEEMEKILNNHKKILEDFNKNLEIFKKSQEDYKKLSDYYSSNKYFEDLEDDEKGLIDEKIPRGVLSEDAVFDLIGENYWTAVKMLEIATDIIKTN